MSTHTTPTSPTRSIIARPVTALALFLFAISYRQVDDAARLASFHVYRILAYILIILLAAFFVSGSRIDWTVLLAGLAWRFWLVCYVLQEVLRALRAE